MPSDSPPAAIPAPEPPTSTPPGLFALFIAFAKMSLAGFGGVQVWARRSIVDQRSWMTADEFNETYALCHFLPGPNVVNLSMVFGSRFRGIPGGIAAFAGLLGPPVVIVLQRLPFAGADPVQHRHRLCHAPAGCGMNLNPNPISTLVWTFGLMSLFAVGGANAAIPEMHRVAVDVQHWMTDKQFADVFAISQTSPGPNVLIVTLIGYSVAGVAGALAATLAMCVPTAVLAYYVSRLLVRSSQSRWPAIIQAAPVPLSIGLMGASGLILALTSDRTGPAGLVTATAAVLAFATRLNPLWMLLAGVCLGFAGVV
jgi:chromate transporter